MAPLSIIMGPILKRLAKIKCRAHLSMHYFSSAKRRVPCGSMKIKDQDVKLQVIDLFSLIDSNFACNANFRLNNQQYFWSFKYLTIRVV
jgi:hypothetical protein